MNHRTTDTRIFGQCSHAPVRGSRRLLLSCRVENPFHNLLTPLSPTARCILLNGFQASFDRASSPATDKLRIGLQFCGDCLFLKPFGRSASRRITFARRTFFAGVFLPRLYFVSVFCSSAVNSIAAATRMNILVARSDTHSTPPAQFTAE